MRVHTFMLHEIITISRYSQISPEIISSDDCQMECDSSVRFI